MHKPLKKKQYTGCIYSEALKRDLMFWIDGDFILPKLSDWECLFEEDVLEEIRDHYRNMEDN